MTDEPDHDDQRYDWLYVGEPEPSQGRPAKPESAPPPSSPSQPKPEFQAGWTRPEPDHTRMLPLAPRPDAPDQATSFGGTYPRSPAASSAPATPRPTSPPSAEPVGPRYAQPTTARSAGAAGFDAPGGVGYAPPPGDPTTYSPTPKPPRRKRRMPWVRIVLALLAAWLVFLVVVPIYAWSKVSKVDAEPSGARPAGGPGTTYLLVGSDSREGLTRAQEHDLGTGAASGQRTDTIILLHVTDGGGPNIMLSIPRDSYVEVPGHGMNKINAAYAYGGPKLLVQTVELATKIRIDDYVEIGFTGVVNVVDAVGGITVCPKTPIDDPKAGNLTMKAGCQQVNGHVALDYSRSRAFPLGDITRALHQREVIAATGSKAASWQTIVFPWRYWSVNLAGANSVQVGDNVGPFAFAKFAWAMAHSSGPGTKRCVVPFSSLGTSTSVGSVVEWDAPKANAIFGDIKTDNTSAIHCTGQ